MLTWMVAAGAGVAAAALLYGLGGARQSGAVLPLAMLRAFALTILFALLFNAPIGAARELPPLVALDASVSWQRAAGQESWREAAAYARSLPGDELLIFGDSVRAGPPPELPPDGASLVQPAVERAIGSGRPLIVVTDGELDDAGALDAAPAGSRIEVRRPARGPDAAVVAIDAPRFAVANDTMTVRITVRTGDALLAGATITVLLDDVVLARSMLDSLPPAAERTEVLRAVVPSREGPSRLRAAVAAPGDAEPRNDTAAVAFDVSRAAAAVFISTAPDFDARYLVPVLRGAVAIPTEAFYRVAPGNWRRERTLEAVSESAVRGAAARAPIVILHGDTSYFGAPRALTTGALALIPAPATADNEWFAVAAPVSPLSAGMADTPWDSLPPLFLRGEAPQLGWAGLIVARARQFDQRPAITGTESGRRVVVIAASGFWRWRFRGGVAADAHSALWGGIFDWLAAERPDPRGAIPATGVVRAGDPVRWRRGTARDSVVVALLAPRAAGAVGDTLVIRFGAGALTAETPPLPEGTYDVELPGGRSVLTVSASRELLPRSATVASGTIAGVAVVGVRPLLRDAGWAYLVLLAALCVEWMLRRRRGLR